MGGQKSTMEKIDQIKILVIGGTGFIGSHLLKAATEKGWGATSISIHPPSVTNLIKGVDYKYINLIDLNAIKSLSSQGYDYVVNLGGYIDHRKYSDGGREVIYSHFIGVLNLISWLPRDRLKCFVQIGSSDEYGDALAPQNETYRESPISPYSLGKVSSTHFLQMLYKTEKFPSVILRLFLTYGPGQSDQRFIPMIIQGCLKDSIFPVSAGGQLRDFCYIDDTVRAILLSLEVKNKNAQIINIASGNPVSIRNVIKTIREIINMGYPDFGKIPYRNKENMELYADVKRAKKFLGWESKTTLDDGLKKTINWFQEKELLVKSEN